VNISEIEKILRKFKEGSIGEREVLQELKSAAVHSLDFAQIDQVRELRQGFPEVVFCEGKTPDQVVGIAEKIYQRNGKVLATRADAGLYQFVRRQIPDLQYSEKARCIHSPFPSEVPEAAGKIAVITAGTSDIPVAEEAVVTCRLFGYAPHQIYDVGVAGLHRLNNHWDAIRNARVLIVIAGMEGALASVIGGLVDRPVIAVPTSVGYGTSFQGLTALFAMLNSCSSNVTVVNIDNGFGAGFSASLILRQILDHS